jgi:hypothetical protein
VCWLVSSSSSTPIVPSPCCAHVACCSLHKHKTHQLQEVDAALLKALSPELKGYLATRFTLRDGDRPHLMKF